MVTLFVNSSFVSPLNLVIDVSRREAIEQQIRYQLNTGKIKYIVHLEADSDQHRDHV